jgi:hypothetical protein
MKNEQELIKQKKAIEHFAKTFGVTYKKLDVDYKIFDKDGQLIAYAEVIVRIRTMRDSFPLPIPAKKLVKLIDKRLVPIVIWCCEDGIIYGKANNFEGVIKWGGSSPLNDQEMIVYYDKQKEFKYVRFS